MLAVKEVIFQYSSLIYERIIEIINTPFQQPEMMWILVPLILTMLLMEFYFGIYKEEPLGWNTAFGNSIVLLFVAADLSKFLYEKDILGQDVKTLIVLAIVAGGILLTLINLLHLLPERLAFNISSKSPMNFIAIVAIILVYSNISLDYLTLSAFIILFIILMILFWLLHYLEPTVKGELTKEAPENKEVPSPK